MIFKLEEDGAIDEQTSASPCKNVSNTLCKIWMDAEVCVLFLPCRHLVCCEKCENMVKKCRVHIVATVSTFLA